MRVIKDDGAIVMTAFQPFTSKLICSNLKNYRYCWVWDKNKATNFMSAKLMPLVKTEDIVVFSKATCNSMSKIKMKYNPQGIIEVNKEVKNGKNVGGKVAADRNAVFHEGKVYTQKYTNYPTNILTIPNDSNKLHPTQKPLELMKYLILTYSDENDTVFDGFMGSGTTIVAAQELNRNAIGVELDKQYFDISKERLNL